MRIFMDVISKIPEIFNAEGIVIERRAVVYLAFSTVVKKIPSDLVELIEIINSIPNRDNFKMILTSDDNENRLELSNENIVDIDFAPLIADAKLDDGIYVQITIDKTVENNVFSVYCFDKFSDDLLKLPTITLMKWFSELFSNSEHLIFQLFDADFSMTTSTIAFIPDEEFKFKANIARGERLLVCKDIGNFYNMSEFELIPDDFNIEGIEPEDNPFRDIFDRLKSIFALIYTASSASILADELSIQINGQRNLTCVSQLDSTQNNEILYLIYMWIYTEGNIVDKVLIARNVMSLHCRNLDLFDLDDKAYAAIKSNYELYLRNNVEQYLALIKEISTYILEVVTQIGDYATTILGKFKKNLMVIGIFFLIVMIPRFDSTRDLDVVFTRDVLYLLQLVLIGSMLYLAICWIELAYKMKKIEKGYNALKENYQTVLSDNEINNILKNDELLTKNVKIVRKSSIIWASIWGFVLVGGIVVIEFFTENRGLITWFLGRIS